MMTSQQWLKFILELNLVFGATYVAFTLAEKSLAALKKTPSPRHLRKVSHLLLVLALVAPLTLALVPASMVPHALLTVEQPLSEGSAFRHKGAKRPVVIDGLRASTPHPSSSSLWVSFEKFLEKNLQKSAAGLVFALAAIHVLLILRFAGQVFRVTRILKDAVTFKTIGNVSVVVSERITIPFSIKLRRAWAVLPVYILANKKDLKVAVQHEIQHHRQNDTAWVFFIETLGIIFFANPFFYLWKKRLTELQELTCDEALIGRKRISSHEYCSCLIRVAEAAIRSRSVYAGTACMASGAKDPKSIQSFLKRRIQMLTEKRRSRAYGKLAAAVGTFLSLLIALIAYGSQEYLRGKNTPVNPGTAAYDPVIQKIAEEALSNALAAHKAKSGFAIVTDPVTGRVLAVADLTSDHLAPAVGALARRIEIASVAKPLMAATAIDRGLTTPNESFNCENGAYEFGGHVYHDWKPFDFLTTEGTVVESSNICGIKLGEKLGASKIEDTYRDFGFGSNGTASVFPGARTGTIPSVGEMPEDDYVAIMATGYSGAQVGFMVTPLEVTQAFGAIANGGELLRPAAAADSGGSVIRQVISPETARQMRAMLTKVVTEGTGRKRAESSLYTTAGKTGTAYDPGTPGHQRLGGAHGIASFVGFAPANTPRVLVYATVSDPGDGEPNGSRLAAPVFKEIAERVLQYWHVPPDKN